VVKLIIPQKSIQSREIVTSFDYFWGFFGSLWEEIWWEFRTDMRFFFDCYCHAIACSHSSQWERRHEKLSHMLSTACFGIFIGFPASTFVKISNSFCSSITLAGGGAILQLLWLRQRFVCLRLLSNILVLALLQCIAIELFYGVPILE